MIFNVLWNSLKSHIHFFLSAVKPRFLKKKLQHCMHKLEEAVQQTSETSLDWKKQSTEGKNVSKQQLQI